MKKDINPSYSKCFDETQTFHPAYWLLLNIEKTVLWISMVLSIHSKKKQCLWTFKSKTRLSTYINKCKSLSSILYCMNTLYFIFETKHYFVHVSCHRSFK